MRQKKIIRLSLLLVFMAFLSINVIAIFQAYKFTHYDDQANGKERIEDASFFEKAKAMIFGVELPRPVDKDTPTRLYKTVTLNNGRKIEGWLIPGDTTTNKGTVILCHGYGGSKSGMLIKSNVFLDSGYNVFIFDFMGSGGSEGNQTTIGYFEASQVKTATDYISETGEKNIILFGTSMGAAAVMKAMHDYNLNPKAVILECPYSSMLRTVQNRFELVGVPKFPMANLLVFWGGVINGFNAFGLNPSEYAISINCPALLIYGQKDNRVMQDETDEIFRNIKSKEKYLKQYPLAGHDDYLEAYSDEWTSDIREFLNRL